MNNLYKRIIDDLVRLSCTPNNTAIIIWFRKSDNLNHEFIFSRYLAIDEVTMRVYFF